MLFNSLAFLIFFPFSVAVYFLLPARRRWMWLLTASYFFYGCWKFEYLALICFSTLIDYFVAMGLGRVKFQPVRHLLLLCSLSTNLGLLVAFKYFNFFSESVQQVAAWLGCGHSFPALDVLLPVGISFYTFQTLSYTIDVYRRQCEPEKHLGYFALYVSFFPQLVAGPIERSTHLLPQFFEKKSLDYRRVTDGLKLMLWGFFKKLVIADRLAVYVNEVYSGGYEGMPVLIATYFFAFQIFCDFSGYSDIAIGTAKVMGFDLMVNFRRPYFSKSIAEFWSRWHISLSTWFRDYLYIPLGGNRRGELKWKRNLLIVFLASGLWHGANWTFMVWGALHAFYMIFSIQTHALRFRVNQRIGLTRHPVLHRFLRTAITFHLVLLAWVFFRAESVRVAVQMIVSVFRMSDRSLHIGILGTREFAVALFAIGLMECVHVAQRRGSLLQLTARLPVWIRWSLYNLMILLILFFGVFNNQQFIYFQF